MNGDYSFLPVRQPLRALPKVSQCDATQSPTRNPGKILLLVGFITADVPGQIRPSGCTGATAAESRGGKVDDTEAVCFHCMSGAAALFHHRGRQFCKPEVNKSKTPTK